MRTTILYSLIFVMTAFFISSCEKEDDASSDSDSSKTPQSSSKFEGTTWYYEGSASANGETTKIKGTFDFLANQEFTYEEEYVEQGSTITMDTVESIAGTYSYSGTPNVDSNLVLTYTDSDNNNVKNYAKYINDSTYGEFIMLTIDGFYKELSRDDDASN